MKTAIQQEVKIFGVNEDDNAAGIYIHVPFCKQACAYCNFHFSTSLKMKDEMLKALMLELQMQKNFLKGKKVSTIYFGGGTPSLLSSDELNRIFDVIFTNYTITKLKECTIEANPDDLNADYLKRLRNTPVDRLSIGVQSFHDSDLKYMHRAHNAQQADYAIKAAQDAGFANLNIDLIYGTPGLSDAAWKQNIEKLKSLQIPHFSAYALTVEEGTALHHSILKKKSKPVDVEQSAAQFEILMSEAAAMGYNHYEISNFALPGNYAIHNTNYWMGIPYLGVGPSAHSFNKKARRWNIANNAVYIKSLLQDKQIPFEEEVLTEEQQLNEYIMTSLRTMWGLDLQKISENWGSDTAKSIEVEAEKYISQSQLKKGDHSLVLTNSGKLFADKIAAELFVQ